jgi:ADP-glucose pyrophosphorylase
MMETNQERMETKADAHLKEMKAELRVNNEKFEVLRGTLVSRMDIQEARTQYA